LLKKEMQLLTCLRYKTKDRKGCMKTMKCLLMSLLLMPCDVALVARDVDYSSVPFCQQCGVTLEGVAFLQAAARLSKNKKLLCLACAKRMKGKKEGLQGGKGSRPTFFFPIDEDSSAASSPTGSPLWLVPPVTFLTLSLHNSQPRRRSTSVPLPAYFAEPLTGEMAATIARLLTEWRKQKGLALPYQERGVFQSERSDAPENNLIHLFECIYGQQADESGYVCELDRKRRIASVIDPRGDRRSFELSPRALPIVWQQGKGGVIMYPDDRGITVRDFERDSLYSFPLDGIPLTVINCEAGDMGFHTVEPLLEQAAAKNSAS